MSDLDAQMNQHLSKRVDEIMPMLERWVRTNSYSANIAGVNEMGELLAEAFALSGLSVERVTGNNVGDHWLWKTPAWGREKNGILLIGHHDTVFPPGSFDCWEIDGDRLRGPGVLDMKGGIATVRAALATLDDSDMLSAIPLAFISVGDEEIGSLDSRAFLQTVAGSAAVALVFEAGRAEDRIITRRKGTGAFKVHCTGRAAHAGNHHAEGINAIEAVSKFVIEAQSLTDYPAGKTVNVGLIAGGEARNTVPGSAECEVDFRFETSESGAVLESDLKAAAHKLEASHGVDLTLSGGIRRMPLERIEGSAALYREYGKAAEVSGLGSGEADRLGGGSDANTVSAVGVPAIDGLGPRGHGFHTHDETIEISSLRLRVDALLRFLLGRM